MQSLTKSHIAFQAIKPMIEGSQNRQSSACRFTATRTASRHNCLITCKMQNLAGLKTLSIS